MAPLNLAVLWRILGVETPAIYRGELSSFQATRQNPIATAATSPAPAFPCLPTRFTTLDTTKETYNQNPSLSIWHPFQGIAIYLHVLPVIRFLGAKCTSFGSRGTSGWNIDLNNNLVSGRYWPIQSFPVVAQTCLEGSRSV